MKNFFIAVFLLGYGHSFGQQVVINELYGAGGNSGAIYTHDYVELFNASSIPVDLGGWSVQYAPATSSGTWQVTLLSGTIEPGRHFLIQLGAGSGNGAPLPIPDVTGTTAMAATAGKVILSSAATPLAGSCPSGGQIIDKVGYGSSATCFEGTRSAPSPSATLAVMRVVPGGDTNQNDTDFQAASPQPQHSFPRTQSISFAVPVGVTYGDTDFDLTATASSGLPVTISSENPSVATVNNMRVSIHGAGTSVLTAVQPGDSRYEPAIVTRTLTISKAGLDVAAPQLSRLQGEPNPVFSLTYSGFVYSDNEGSLEAIPIAICSADQNSPPGDYPISIVATEDNNYEFQLVPGMLTVLPRPSNEPASWLKSPDANQVCNSLAPRLTATIVPGASVYTFELSETPSFVPVQWTNTGARSQVAALLSTSTTYYVRVKTDLSASWGPVRTFTTGAAAAIIGLRKPADGSSGVSWLPRLVANSVGDASYTFQVSTSALFDSQLIYEADTAAVTITSPLNYHTSYFVRVSTSSAPGVWGPVISFTTGHPAEYSSLRSPVDGATDVVVNPRVTVNLVPGASSYQLYLRVLQGIGQDVSVGSDSRTFVVLLSPATTYEAKVRTNLSDEWGKPVVFSTESSLISYVTSPGETKLAMTSPIVTAKYVHGAGRYTIELNTASDFSGPGEVKTAKGRSIRFHLQGGLRYYARVQTDVLPGQWGPVKWFETEGNMISSAGKSAENPRKGPATEPLLESNQSTITGDQPYPNPFLGEFTVPAGEVDRVVRIYSLQGNVMENSILEAGKAVILGQALLPGIYWVEVEAPTGRRVYRMVKL